MGCRQRGRGSAVLPLPLAPSSASHAATLAERAGRHRLDTPRRPRAAQQPTCESGHAAAGRLAAGHVASPPFPEVVAGHSAPRCPKLGPPGAGRLRGLGRANPLPGAPWLLGRRQSLIAGLDGDLPRIGDRPTAWTTLQEFAGAFRSLSRLLQRRHVSNPSTTSSEMDRGRGQPSRPLCATASSPGGASRHRFASRASYRPCSGHGAESRRPA